MPTVKKKFSEFLEQDCGYLHVRRISPTHFAAINILIFTDSLITIHDGDTSGIDDRWCYEHGAAALEALEEWALRDYQGEPQGWHRHPATGRRRPNGDAAQEYINF